MSRPDTLTTDECFKALSEGYILENEHGYKVWLKNNHQVITNKNRRRRKRGSFSYKFDYPTWRIVGRVSLLERFKNKLYYLKEKLWF